MDRITDKSAKYRTEIQQVSHQYRIGHHNYTNKSFPDDVRVWRDR